MSTEQKLENIAKMYLGFQDLKNKNSDGADFREVAVWSVKEALEAAFKAGQDAANASRGN